MSGQDTPPALAAADGDRSVAEYLRRNPGFLARHPELIALLEVPHDCGDAVSLIEYQVDALRTQCQELRTRMSSLVANARSNEELAQRLHRLVLGLVESPGLDELFTSLYQGLGEGFGADLVSLRVFADPVAGEDRGLAELVGAQADQRVFAALFEGGHPVCGQPDPALLEALFAGRAAKVASAALLPLSIGERRGVLAIGSHAAARFHPSMGTLYLRQLADVLARLLRRRVQ